jgi:hypothetical protein
MDLLRRPWRWLGQPSGFTNGGVLVLAGVVAALDVVPTAVNIALGAVAVVLLGWAGWSRQHRKG